MRSSNLRMYFVNLPGPLPEPLGHQSILGLKEIRPYVYVDFDWLNTTQLRATKIVMF